MAWKAGEGIDSATNVLETIDYAHHEVHSGSGFHISYSVASVGALETPTDLMTLTFKTANTTKWAHMVVAAICSSGARFRFIEGSSGGGASPTSSLTILNSNRNSGKTSGIFDVAGTPVVNKMSYDATLLTGGTSLVDEIVGADGQGNSFAAGSSRSVQEWVLLQNTIYQVSLLEADTVPGTLQLSWYEHTDKN